MGVAGIRGVIAARVLTSALAKTSLQISNRCHMRVSSWISTAAILVYAGHAQAQTATTAGAVTTPYPTFENVSIEWAISGDTNSNGEVKVQYRETGESAYRAGLPLFRVPAGKAEGFSWTNKHSGSLFGLQPGTSYEVELTLADPDGGNATKTLTVSTRALPKIPATGREVPLTPSTLTSTLRSAKPGDVLVFEDGTYPEVVVSTDGSAGQPITLRPRNANGAILSGGMRLDGRSHIQVEGFTVRGRIRFNDAESIVVAGCNIETSSDGITSMGKGVNNAYIVNNVIRGVTTWKASGLGVDGDNIGEGVQITGAGNVVAFNKVSGFRDCLSLMEEDEAVNQTSIDFYGNDLSACGDDAIEADFAMGNVRVYRNRISESFMGISSQPGLGGPNYFVRNVMYNVLYQAFKLQRGSVGDVGLHNTVVKSGDAFSVYTEDPILRAYFRNNLFIGGPGGSYGGYNSGSGRVMMLQSADDSCSFDYDGYGAVGVSGYSGTVGDTRFTSLAQQRSTTSEQHATQVDMAVFATAPQLPADPFVVRPFPSLLLAEKGAAVDKGVALPNINDGFTGSQPDLGAYESGTPEPKYGPGGTSPASGGTNGGASASGGRAGGGAANGSGGSNSSAGASSGGQLNATGGSPSAATGGTAGSPGAAGSDSSPGEGDAAGCSCRTVPHQASSGRVVGALSMLAFAFARRRSRRRTSS